MAMTSGGAVNVVVLQRVRQVVRVGEEEVFGDINEVEQTLLYSKQCYD